jgi:4-hydroxythreonine-4-phosphate dehydrogenase
MSQHHKPKVGITLGDPNGIGPEVVIKALSDHRIFNMATPVIYGNGKVISFYKKLLNIEEFNYSQVRSKGQFLPKSVNVVNCWEDTMEVVPGKPSTQSGTAALTALRKACEELKEGVLDALVTGPIDKHAVHSTDFPFAGHTEFLTQHFGATESLMLMVGESLRVGLVTEHVAIKDVAQYITREKVESKLRILEQSLRKDFGISKPRIAVLGLNPHAGDSGLIGQEEEQVLKPLISDFRNKGKLVYGPFSPDGFFATGQHVKYDAVLAMYHDQGLIPFKSIAFGGRRHLEPEGISSKTKTLAGAAAPASCCESRKAGPSTNASNPRLRGRLANSGPPERRPSCRWLAGFRWLRLMI